MRKRVTPSTSLARIFVLDIWGGDVFGCDARIDYPRSWRQASECPQAVDMMPSRRRFLVKMLQPLGLKLGVMLGMVNLPRQGFAAKSVSEPEPERFREALRLELRGAEAFESRDITLDVPDVAEDGAVVPILLESRILATDRLVLLVAKNPFPLIASFQFAGRASPFVSLRIKMNESSAVVALARAKGKFYRTMRQVRVVRGGCS
jgi:sulfur-oxidizing protein SoxY